VPYLSASAVVIHYKEALYQVYAPLPLPYLEMAFDRVPRKVICTLCVSLYITITADTNHYSMHNLCIAQHITSLGTLSNAISKSTSPKYTFLPLKLSMKLPCHKCCIRWTFAWHETKLHIISLHLL